MGKQGVKDIFISVVLGYILYSLTALSFFIAFPILMLSRRYGCKEVGIASAMLGLLITLTTVWHARGAELNTLTVCNLLIGLFIPFSLLIAAFLWVKADGENVIKRWIVSILPALIGFLAFVLWFSFDPALFSAVVENLKTTFNELWGPLLAELGIDHVGFFELVIKVVCMSYLPIIVLTISTVTFIATASLKAHDSGFNDEVATFTVPERAVSLLLLVWMLIILGRFFAYPEAVKAVLVAIATVTTSVYTFQGYAIAYYHRRKHHQAAKASNLFFVILAAVMLMPGVNIALVFILSVIGILETWFTLRK
jgi:hypothetical protein